MAAVVEKDACYQKLQSKKEEQEQSQSPMSAPMLRPRRACTPQSRLAAHGHRCAICGEHESAIRARDALAIIPNSERCDCWRDEVCCRVMALRVMVMTMEESRRNSRHRLEAWAE